MSNDTPVSLAVSTDVGIPSQEDIRLVRQDQPRVKLCWLPQITSLFSRALAELL